MKPSLLRQYSEVKNSKFASHTDLGFGLKESVQRLVECAATDYLIVPITDGSPRPIPDHETEEYTLESVHDWLQVEMAVISMPIGVGSGTEYLLNIFPLGIIVNDPERLPDEFTNGMENMIQWILDQ